MVIKFRFRNDKEITLYEGKYNYKIYRLFDKIFSYIFGVNLLMECHLGVPTVIIFYR